MFFVLREVASELQRSYDLAIDRLYSQGEDIPSPEEFFGQFSVAFVLHEYGVVLVPEWVEKTVTKFDVVWKGPGTVDPAYLRYLMEYFTRGGARK